jgi:pSer/pThr/pTyr-binding forkhead associated (FHA) protein
MSLEWVLLGLRLLATIVLYSFIGVAFYLIWRELKHEAGYVPGLGGYDRLRIIKTDGETWSAGQLLPLQTATSFGRAPDNTIVLSDEAISASHAFLYQKDGIWWLEDLASTNGTRLNELPISKPTPLTHGDLIEIGNHRFRLETMEA